MTYFIKRKSLHYTLTTFAILLAIYLFLGFLASRNMFYVPVSDAIDLIPILTQTTYSEADYTCLFEQTGLAPPVINELRAEPDFIAQMLRFQSNYLKSINIKKTNMNSLTRLDKVLDHEGTMHRAFELAPYHNGYIFLTKSTYTANWRHGHAGIVVDEKRGKILESLEPGTKSMEQNISRWEFYPTFKMMRLKDAPQSYLNQIADYARTHLIDIPYNIFSFKNQGVVPKSTHCSSIVWQAFKHFGIDLDSNGGLIVTPEDLARSPYLETLQIFGFHPERAW